MPKYWVYYVAVLLPVIFRLIILNTGFVNWLWYQGYEQQYYFFSSLAINPIFLEMIANWALALFALLVIAYWIVEEDKDSIGKQFLLLPLVYVPFCIVGAMLTNFAIDVSMFIRHPLVIIPFGYIYIFPWVIIVWLLEKLRIVE